MRRTIKMYFIIHETCVNCLTLGFSCLLGTYHRELSYNNISPLLFLESKKRDDTWTVVKEDEKISLFTTFGFRDKVVFLDLAPCACNTKTCCTLLL